MLPYLDGYISHIAWTLFGTVVSLEFPSLSNKPLQRTGTPQGHWCSIEEPIRRRPRR